MSPLSIPFLGRRKSRWSKAGTSDPLSRPRETVAPAPGAPLAGERRTDISWLRVLAVLLLFPFHTARVFNSGEEFYVKSDTLSDALSCFIAFVGPWHMPLLFLLAGAASWFALSRRGGGRYSLERCTRLLVPFLFGLLVLIPPQSYLGLLSHAGSAPGFFGWLPDFFRLDSADPDGYFLGGHTWGHLWFIIHLFFYALLALPVLLFLRSGAGRKVVDLLARAVAVRGVVLLFAVALVPALPVPDIAGGNPVLYIAVFLLGYLLVSDVRFEQAIDRHRLAALIMGPVACLASAYLYMSGLLDSAAWLAQPAWIRSIVEVYTEAILPWCCLVALLAYGRRFFGPRGRLAVSPAGRPGGWADRFLRYTDEASYPVYLLHQTVIIAVAFVVMTWEVGVGAGFAAILIVSIAVTFAVYELVVRRVVVARVLFGMKPRRTRSGSGAPVAVGPGAGSGAGRSVAASAPRP